MNEKVTIIGGGIIGLSCAYYLQKGGYEVTLVDRGDITSGTSFGNAGYVSPSHFIPLASPAIVGKALLWMLNSSSPFYIKPSLNKDLISWGMAFWRSASKQNMARNIPPLNRLLQRSHGLMLDMRDDLGNHFKMEEKGCLMLYKTRAAEKQEQALAKEAAHFGLRALILDGSEVQLMQSKVETDVSGGVFYPIDCHLHPGELIETLKARLIFSGVKFLLNTQVTGFRVYHNRIQAVLTNNGELEANELVLAAGSWMPELTGMLGIRLLMQPGKGYSMTYPNVTANLSCPAILSERRIALTPMGRDLRLGGTMELSGINDQVLPKRVKAIFEGAKTYFPGLPVSAPEISQVWSGLRPLSPDGLPYIGRYRQFNNLIIAGGHAMLGLSLAAATGNMVEELLSDRGFLDDLPFFRPDRF